VIDGCERWRAACGGAFTARLGEVEGLWNAAQVQGAAPSAALLRDIVDRHEGAPVVLNRTARAIDRRDVTFAVDAYAKGYIVDAALRAAQKAAPSAQGMLLDIGGDVSCLGAAPDAIGWRIGIASGAAADNARPAQILRVGDKAVATSGAGARDRTIDGCAYSHILSPSTGRPVAPSTVTVIADKAADADALSTALSVMPVRQGLALADSLPGVEARILTGDGTEHVTSGWGAYLTPLVATSADRLRPTLAAFGSAAAWPAGFEVDIQYEISELSAGRYRPPFLVIWITDQNDALVRTLFHLGTRPRRYLNSNYVWWKTFGDTPALEDKLDTVTRPSRPPGRYTAVWDGKDDAGRPVGQGKYTINIETSREHGGHTYQAIQLDLGARPVSGAAAGGVEAGPAAARYGKAG
jgi:thiamine biosynthesis lipoprotein